MKNQRKESRLKEENKLTFMIVSEDKNPLDENAYLAFTEDISSGGIKIITNKLLEIGALLEIELSLGRKNKAISLFGRVQWIRHLYDGELFAVGVMFEDNPAENIMSLMEYIYKKRSSSSKE
jgi:Tfp pilus assembly protein PilZ